MIGSQALSRICVYPALESVPVAALVGCLANDEEVWLIFLVSRPIVLSRGGFWT
jgi:hypothetical protein